MQEEQGLGSKIMWSNKVLQTVFDCAVHHCVVHVAQYGTKGIFFFWNYFWSSILTVAHKCNKRQLLAIPALYENKHRPSESGRPLCACSNASSVEVAPFPLNQDRLHTPRREGREDLCVSHGKYARSKVILEEKIPFTYTYYTVAHRRRIALLQHV